MPAQMADVSLHVALRGLGDSETRLFPLDVGGSDRRAAVNLAIAVGAAPGLTEHATGGSMCQP
jgi:hypothetical protein